MSNLKTRFKRYVGIFRGVPIPWAMLVLVLALYTVNTHFELASVTLTASIIDSTQNTIQLDKLVRFVLVTVGAAVMSVAISYTSEWSYQKINMGVRNKMWNKLMRLPTRYYDGENGDALVSRITTDASKSYLYFHTIINIFSVLYSAVVSLRQMWAYSPELSRYMLLLIPVILELAWIFGRLSLIAGRKEQTSFAATLSFLVETTRNLRLVNAARTEAYEQQRGKDKFHKQFRASWWTILASNSQIMLIELLSVAAMAITFIMGRNLVNSGAITIGKLIGFYTISSMMSLRLIQVMIFYGQIKEANGRMEKIAEVLDAAEEKREGIELDVADEDLVAEDVSFSYADRPTLRHVNFRIPKGQVTAIVGPNGAGKSTLFKLLERMYDAESGALRFGKEDVRTFDLTSWRSSFAIVSQDKPLLSGTVRENILYGTRRRVSEEELIRVAKLANVYDFVMDTPGGFDAPVGMGGGNFSGGQRQCIAIARAMMRNPDYLLLDEATASLDAKSERLVSEALENLMKGRTTVMIAHSYSATRNAGHIIVMRDGQVEAEGSPEELLTSSAYYRSFVMNETA